jgi:carboxyl-terminal processing protease
MKKNIIIIVSCLFFTQILFAKELKVSDVNKVMKIFLEYHVENKELTSEIVQRMSKLYIQRFDSEKIYFLAKEIRPYYEMNSNDAKKIVNNIKKGDFSDFQKLNNVIQKAIKRSRLWRVELENSLIINDVDFSNDLRGDKHYAFNEKELKNRQLKNMKRFLSFHKKRTVVDNQDKRRKVFALYERRVNSIENNYLFLNSEQKALPLNVKENIFSQNILKSFSKSLDAHSSFFSDEEAYEMRSILEKQFEGIGVVLSESIDGVQITSLVEGSPAEKCQMIEVNDIIVEIDGQSIREMAFEKVLQMMQKSNKITLGLINLQNADNIKRVSLKKKPIQMDSDRLQYSYESFGDGIIGKLVLTSFYENSKGVSSEKDIKDAVAYLKKQGNLKGIVLDLRNNTGGFLTQAIKVTGLFMSHGVVAIAKYSNKEISYLRNLDGRIFFKGPLVVLTSKFSASASEIVAQALQDYGLALVVGDERTFGKGSIQLQTVTDKDSTYFFKVTIGKYYTVSGKTTQINGVQADIVVPSEYSPYKLGEKYLEYPLSNDSLRPAFVDNLSDIDKSLKIKFQKYYLPYQQKKVNSWQNYLPVLRKNSYYRQAHNKDMQSFVDRINSIRSNISNKQKNNVQKKNYGCEDLQMQEAVNIIRDMCILQTKDKQFIENRLSSNF